MPVESATARGITATNDQRLADATTDVCVLIFPPIYTKHNQCPCRCLLEERALLPLLLLLLWSNYQIGTHCSSPLVHRITLKIIHPSTFRTNY